MKHTIVLPIALLKAALIVVAKDSLNYESVVIDKGHIVSTDRNMLFWAKLENVDNDLRIVIPRIHVECFIKKAEYFSGNLCQIIFDTEKQNGYLEIPNCLGCFEGFSQVFTKFADWQKAIPDTNSESMGFPQFAYKYHKKLVKIALELGNICYPKIIPTGVSTAALIEFLYSEYNDVHVCLMPLDLTFSKVKYCVEFNEDGDSEWEQVPAASAEIALQAAQRTIKDLNYGRTHFFQHSAFVRPAMWLGSDQEHTEKLLYTEDWFKQPLKQYDNAKDAIEYMTTLNECVICYIGDKSITAYTPEEATRFFTENGVSGNA